MKRIINKEYINYECGFRYSPQYKYDESYLRSFLYVSPVPEDEYVYDYDGFKEWYYGWSKDDELFYDTSFEEYMNGHLHTIIYPVSVPKAIWEKDEESADYYYLQIRMTKNDPKYHEVKIRLEDTPSYGIIPMSYTNYEQFVLSVYEAYCKANQYYYYSLWGVWGNYHGVISEYYNTDEKPFYYDAHEEAKKFLQRVGK